MRREMYDDAQVHSKTELQRISPLRNSTPIGGMGIGIARAAENKPEPDARQALQNLSLSMQKVQSGSEAAERRDFFLQYLHKEISSLRYAMSQDALNNIKPTSNFNRMMGTAEGDKGGSNGANGSKGGYGYNANRGNNANGDNINLQNKPQYPCPVN